MLLNLKNYLKNNIVLAVFITSIFIFIEQFFRIYNDLLSFNLTFKSLIEQIIINLLILSIVNKRIIIFIYFLLSIFTYFQLTHFSYYGNWIFPLEYLLFFTEFNEVIKTFYSIKSLSYIPAILSILLFIFCYIIIQYKDKQRVKVTYLGYFLILFIIFIPIRIYIKDDYTRASKPNFEHYIAKNTILTLSNLFGNIIPKKISGQSGLVQEIIETPIVLNSNPNINLVVIMGETLHREFMSLYDYSLNSSPYLKELKNQNDFLYKRAIGSGVSTTIAIPSFFNMIKKPDSIPQILSTNTCLFKMAKNNGFNTYFFSSQAQEELKSIKSYLCGSFIDKLSDGSSITKNSNKSALDETLIDRLDEVDFSKPSFITLNQRASHTPFLEHIPDNFRPFNISNTNNLSQNIIDYLNTIRYTDEVIKGIIEKLKEKTSRPTYIIFTSDHATSLDDKSRNGHGLLDNDSVYQVPFFIYSLNTKNEVLEHFSDFDYISHYQISNLVSHLLGYRTDYNTFNIKEDYFVCGNDLSGLGGFMKISFDIDNKIIQE